MSNITNVNSVRFLNKYYNTFSKYTFIQLLENYSKIESDLIEILKVDIDTFIQNCGYLKGKEDHYTKGNKGFRLMIRFSKERHLTIAFPDILMFKADKKISKVITEFGLINEVEIVYNENTGIDFEGLFEILSTEINSCYIALEEFFIRGGSDFSESAYMNLNSCLESALKIQHQNKELIRKCFFLISDKKFGYSYFDIKSIEPIVEKLKSDQHPFFSPFQILIWLISTPFPYDKSISLQSRKENKEISIPVNDISYFKDYPDMLTALMIGLSTEDLTVEHIHQERNYSLSITFPTAHKELILPVVRDSKEMLIDGFQNGIQKCSPFLNTLNSFSKTVKNSDLLDAVYTITAKLGVEMMKTQ